MKIRHEDLAEALGVSRPRVSQLVSLGMPTDSIDAAIAWRDARRMNNQRNGTVAIPVQPLNMGDLDNILNVVAGAAAGESGGASGGLTQSTGDEEMDRRIREQAELCNMTRQAFLQAMTSGDPSQAKLYGNYDRAIATLLRLERERHVRLQERGRLVDADEAAARFGKILGQLRSLIERAELTFAPKANPEDPPKALNAFRIFRDDTFRKLSEYNPQVALADAASIRELPPVEEPEEEGNGSQLEGAGGGFGIRPVSRAGLSLKETSDGEIEVVDDDEG